MSIGFWHILEEFSRARFLDMTHSFFPGIPHASDMPDEQTRVLYHYDEDVGELGAGFLAHYYCHVGQWGTHVDPPAHFVRGKRYLDEIPVQEMVMPMVVFDVRQNVEDNPDYELQLSDVRTWESRHGPVPEKGFAVMRTGWSARWPDGDAMANRTPDGASSFPGWGLEALRYLVEVRNITAIGHETTDTDIGKNASNDSYPVETYILTMDRYQIEMLAILQDIPAAGAIAVVTFPKPLKGSGFPARVFAICP